MKTKIIFFVLTIFSLLLFKFPQPISADTQNSNFRAVLTSSDTSDYRAMALKSFLEKNNSPLAPYAFYMVNKADQYAIPWDLLAAISGTESTWATAEPANCYNAWGFGIYGDQTRCFNSYEEAIDTISKSIRTDYIDKGGCRYVDDIGRMYASSPYWADHTKGFMQQIEDYAESYKIYSLPISM